MWGDRRRGDPGGCAAAAVDSTIGGRVTHFCGETGGGEGTLVGVQLQLSIALSGAELLTFVGRQEEERGPWWVCSCCCR